MKLQSSAMSHPHVISSRISSLERTWVLTKQAEWEPCDLNFCGRSISFLFQGRNEVCGIRDQMGGIREQKDGIWDHSPVIRDHRPRDRDQQFFLGIRDQAVPYLWDQGRKLVTLLESRIRNLHAKIGSAMKKHTPLPPCYSVTALVHMKITSNWGKPSTGPPWN